ncbi:MAG: hypothetical protein E7494_12515 [Ruminococcus albus]|nr:hypothetical protein [Ruminococcus albus]
MRIKRLSTPFGHIEVLKNGVLVEFEIEQGSDQFEGYYLNDVTKLYPSGLYTIIIPIDISAIGDTYNVRYSKGELNDDGGGENTRNAICELDGYVFGLGWADTEYIEDGYKFWYPELYNDRTRILPYSENGIIGSGIEFEIIPDAKYNDLDERIISQSKEIRIIAAWTSSDSPYAWNIISYVTC